MKWIYNVVPSNWLDMMHDKFIFCQFRLASKQVAVSLIILYASLLLSHSFYLLRLMWFQFKMVLVGRGLIMNFKRTTLVTFGTFKLSDWNHFWNSSMKKIMVLLVLFEFLETVKNRRTPNLLNKANYLVEILDSSS